VTLEQLEKFCGSAREFTKKPFAIEKWRVATDGFLLVAENGISPIKLPELEPCANREYILRLLSVVIPPNYYSIEHLKGFLGDSDTEISESILFNGHRVDKTKLRKAFLICDEPYRFAVSFEKHGIETLHTLHFQFGKTILLVMGMREPMTSDPRYEPLPMKITKVSQ
jgi:hypothetical protein